jgi:DNA-binding transcriptional LysR family regulator
MSHPQLAALDLNLLIAFEALCEERNVTRAGRKLGLSQPAMSGALSRLRAMMNDPLFVRGRGGLVPTDRCAALAAPLAKALLDIRNALAGTAFDPATTERELTVGAVDAAIAVVIPHVAARFAELAPRALLSVRAIDPARAVDLVEAGALDLALTPRVRPSSTVKHRALFPLEFWLTVRRDHPLARGPLTPQRLGNHPRLQVSFDGAPLTGGAIDIRPTLSVSSFLAVPHVLAECAAWSLLPAPFARKLTADGPFVARPLPLPSRGARTSLRMVWPLTHDASPTSRWLRDLVLQAAARVSS